MKIPSSITEGEIRTTTSHMGGRCHMAWANFTWLYNQAYWLCTLTSCNQTFKFIWIEEEKSSIITVTQINFSAYLFYTAILEFVFVI